MDGIGGHHLSEVSQVQKTQRPYVFSHMWKIDPKDKHSQENKHDHIHIYNRTCCQCWSYAMEVGRRGKGKGNNRASIILNTHLCR
jgi:hypothetical protein